METVFVIREGSWKAVQHGGTCMNGDAEVTAFVTRVDWRMLRNQEKTPSEERGVHGEHRGQET